MSVVDRLDTYQRKHKRIGLPLGVIYKFVDDQGAYLAALITYYALLSIFPLLLLLTSILGFLVQGNDSLRETLVDGVLAQLPVIGNELKSPSGLKGNVVAVIIGSITAAYGGLGVAQALQHAMNTVWGVPRHRRPNPFLARAKSAGLLLILGTALLGAGSLPRVVSWLDGRVWLVVNAVLAVLVFWVLLHFSTHRSQTWRSLLPGAVLIGLAWQLLETIGGRLVDSVITRSSASYGVFAVVLGLILWIFALAVALVFAAELNVVLARQLYPRALLTPFIDDVDLTRADHEAYAQLVRMHRLKGFQQVEVSFDKDEDGVPDTPSDDAEWTARLERRKRWTGPEGS